MEKKGELVVFRTPGGGVGQESRRLQQTYCTQTDTPCDTNSSAMLGTSRENHRRNPAVAPLKHPEAKPPLHSLVPYTFLGGLAPNQSAEIYGFFVDTALFAP